MIVLRSNGDISASSVFIRHLSSLVRLALRSSPLLSVTRVEYSILSGKGKTWLSNTNKTTRLRIPIPTRLRSLNKNCFDILYFILFLTAGKYRYKGERFLFFAALSFLKENFT